MVRGLTTWAFFHVGKDVKNECALSNFCLHLYNMNSDLRVLLKSLLEKNGTKEKVKVKV